MHDERWGRKACQRAPKPPFGFWLFIRGIGGETCVLFYVFALVHFTRFRLVRWRAGGVRFTRLCRKAKHHLFATISLPQALLPPDSCLLRPDGGALASPEEVPLGCTNYCEIVGSYGITNVLRTWQLGGCVSLSFFLGTAARRGKGISGAPQPT